MTASSPPRRSPAEQDKLNGFLADLFEQRITFNQVLGLKVVTAEPPPPTQRVEIRPPVGGHKH